MPWDHTFHSCFSSSLLSFPLTSDDTCFFFLSIAVLTCASATPPFIYWFLHNQFSLPPCLRYITCCGGTLDSLFLSRTRTHVSFWEIFGDLTMSFDQDLCYLCKEDLRDPVSIPCGHIFCSVCIKTYWDHAEHTGQYLCPQCRVNYNKRPNPRRLQSSRRSSSSLRNSDSFPPAPPAPDYNYAGPRMLDVTSASGRSSKLSSLVWCVLLPTARSTWSPITNHPPSNDTSWSMRSDTLIVRSARSTRKVWSFIAGRTRCVSVCCVRWKSTRATTWCPLNRKGRKCR